MTEIGSSMINILDLVILCVVCDDNDESRKQWHSRIQAAWQSEAGSWKISKICYIIL